MDESNIMKLFAPSESMKPPLMAFILGRPELIGQIQ